MLDDNILLGNTRMKTRDEMEIRVPLFSAFFLKMGIDFSFKSFLFPQHDHYYNDQGPKTLKDCLENIYLWSQHFLLSG